jgi:hypothetical protein
MGDLCFELLAEVVEGAVEEGAEEDQLPEDLLVSLAEIGRAEVVWKFLEKLLVFFIVEPLLDLRGFFDVVVDFEG